VKLQKPTTSMVWTVNTEHTKNMGGQKSYHETENLLQRSNVKKLYIPISRTCTELTRATNLGKGYATSKLLLVVLSTIIKVSCATDNEASKLCIRCTKYKHINISFTIKLNTYHCFHSPILSQLHHLQYRRLGLALEYK